KALEGMGLDELRPLRFRDALQVPLREDRLWSDTVHSHIERPGLSRNILREELDACLRRGIGDWRPWVRATAGRRRDGDDDAGSSLLHAGQEALDREERRRQVPLDGRAPSFFARLLDRPRRAVATSRIHDEDINRPELLLDTHTHRFDLDEVR